MGGGVSKPVSADDPTIVTVFSVPVISAEEIQKLLIKQRPQLSKDAIGLFQEARKKMTNEEDLYHATLKIFCDDHIYKIVSGDGTNEIVVQRDGDKILVDWTKKSFSLVVKDKFFELLNFLKDSAALLVGETIKAAPKAMVEYMKQGAK